MVLLNRLQRRRLYRVCTLNGEPPVVDLVRTIHIGTTLSFWCQCYDFLYIFFRQKIGVKLAKKLADFVKKLPVLQNLDQNIVF
jgi:hypothetical protein